MTDFFGGLNSGNIRFTDSRINGGGPLPTSLSGPEGINGDPDGRYNFNDSLLSGIAPYAGPKSGRMGSDRNYQHIPHRKQYPVPKIFLPESAWDTNETFDMSHPIDMGDVAFSICMNNKHYILTGMLPAVQNAQDVSMPNYNAFANICTVNYLLAGIQNYAYKYVTVPDEEVQHAATHHAWYKLLFCLELDVTLKSMRDALQKQPMLEEELCKRVFFLAQMKIMLQSLIRDKIRPLGICSASEKQGGQHETGYKPVQAAACFFVTLTVDGQNRDLVNIWRGVDIAGGDNLILQLDLIKQPPSKYCLNHYYKGWIQRGIPAITKYGTHEAFQLIPGVERTAFSQTPYWSTVLHQLTQHEQLTQVQRTEAERVKPFMLAAARCLMDNRQFGFWHIGQAYSMKQKFDSNVVPHDDMAMTRGPIMQINFAPVWRGAQQDLFTQFWEQKTTASLDEAYFQSLAECQLLDSVMFSFVTYVLQVCLLRAEETVERDRMLQAYEVYEEFYLDSLPRTCCTVVLNARKGTGDLILGKRSVAPGLLREDIAEAVESVQASSSVRFKKTRVEQLLTQTEADKQAEINTQSESLEHTLPPATGMEQVAQATGMEQVAQATGMEQVAQATGMEKVAQASGSELSATLNATARSEQTGWDFEKDLAAIFSETTQSDSAVVKARAKAKTKGPQS